MTFINMLNALLEKLDEEFDPPLSSSVSIPSYSHKILNNARILSYHEMGNLTAFIAFYCNDLISKVGYLSILAVAKEKRGNGLAINLINSSIDVLKKEGFKTYRLEVYKSNNRAIGLYKKLGFIIIAEVNFSYIMEMEIK